jgi:hypothetical protein
VNNKHFITALFLLVAACTATFGDTLVVPNAQATAVGNAGSAHQYSEEARRGLRLTPKRPVQQNRELAGWLSHTIH